MQLGHVAVSEDILVANEDLGSCRLGRQNAQQSVTEVKDGVAKLHNTNYQAMFTLELSEENIGGWRSRTRGLGFNLCVAPLLKGLSP